MAPVDLNEVVDRALMLVRHHLTISGISLHGELLEGDSEIVADAGQLQQALVALFVNAVEAMSGQDDGELKVRLRGTPDEVRIDVEDTGVGIPPEVLPQIFEPFFSTKEKESGVGLGLGRRVRHCRAARRTDRGRVAGRAAYRFPICGCHGAPSSTDEADAGRVGSHQASRHEAMRAITGGEMTVHYECTDRTHPGRGR